MALALAVRRALGETRLRDSPKTEPRLVQGQSKRHNGLDHFPGQRLPTPLQHVFERSGHAPSLTDREAIAMELVAIAENRVHEGRVIRQCKVSVQEPAAGLRLAFKQVLQRRFCLGCIDSDAIKRSGLDSLL